MKYFRVQLCISAFQFHHVRHRLLWYRHWRQWCRCKRHRSCECLRKGTLCCGSAKVVDGEILMTTSGTASPFKMFKSKKFMMTEYNAIIFIFLMHFLRLRRVLE